MTTITKPASVELADLAVDQWQAMQKRQELAGLLALLASRPKMRAVLEIGGMHGATMRCWQRFCFEIRTLICVDMFVLEGRMEHAPEDYCLVNADSHDQKTLWQVQDLLHRGFGAHGSRSVDMLFIDGDHSLPGVTADFKMYSPLVKPGGLVVLHDTGRPHENVEAHCIIPLWEHLQQTYDTLQIFDTHEQDHWGGIGVVFWP